MSEVQESPVASSSGSSRVAQLRKAILVLAAIVALSVTLVAASNWVAGIYWRQAEDETQSLLEGIQSGKIGPEEVAAMTAYRGDSADDYAKSVPALREKLNSTLWEVISSGIAGRDGDPIYVTVVFSEDDSEGGTDTGVVLWSRNEPRRPYLIGSAILGSGW